VGRAPGILHPMVPGGHLPPGTVALVCASDRYSERDVPVDGCLIRIDRLRNVPDRWNRSCSMLSVTVWKRSSPGCAVAGS
jgi:hypothetical protein